MLKQGPNPLAAQWEWERRLSLLNRHLLEVTKDACQQGAHLTYHFSWKSPQPRVARAGGCADAAQRVCPEPALSLPFRASRKRSPRVSKGFRAIAVCTILTFSYKSYLPARPIILPRQHLVPCAVGCFACVCLASLREMYCCWIMLIIIWLNYCPIVHW